jgi:AAA15 family ATPase/GTPase
MQPTTKITAFYVENFKAIRKGTWFELNKLNILTGANSSGKSTLFNAMKIFTEGFVDGDFPLIDIRKALPDAGFFNNLLNFNTSKKYFWLGFRYNSIAFKGKVEVKYKFVKEEQENTITVAEVEIKLKNKHLLSFYRPAANKPEVAYYKNKQKELIRFVGIDDDNNPGEIVFAIDLQMLANSKTAVHYQKYEDVFAVLQKNFPNGIWTGELLDENDYYVRMPFTRFSDEFFFELYNDSYCNLLNYEGKYPIFYDSDGGEAHYEYNQRLQQIGYTDFIKEYFREFLNELSAQIRFFYQKQLFHLDLNSDIQKRIIDANSLNIKIIKLNYINKQFIEKNNTDSLLIKSLFVSDFEVMYDWLKLFDLPGYFITKEIENAYHQVIYVDDDKREINIADLGKGHAKLIQLMLAIGYKLFMLSDEDRGKQFKWNRTKPQLIIHIEEPEAYLHPKWQSLLADFFVMLSKNHKVQFLIETHSVYLIQKLQLLVARNEIEPNEVSLLYFEQAKKDVSFRKINIRKDGLLKESFGEGFYDESAHLAVALLEHENLN